MDGASSVEDLVSLILQITSLPSNGDTRFTQITQQNPLKSYDRPQQLVDLLGTLFIKLQRSDVAKQLLALYMLNLGNFIDITCELQRQSQAGIAANFWQQVAAVIVQLPSSSDFKFKRSYISQIPFRQIGEYGRDQAILDAKANIQSQLSVNVDLSYVSFDSLSFKIAPSGIEYYCQLMPELLSTIGQDGFYIVDQLQAKLKNTIQIALQDSRAQAQTQPDALISDFTAFIEMQIAATDDPQIRDRVNNMGDVILIKYLEVMQPMFAQGVIPGTIQPGKISACSDMVSQTELRAAIQELATLQFVQRIDTMDQPNVRVAGEILGQSNSDLSERWSLKQAGSINNARLVDELTTKGNASFHSRALNEQQELTNQLAGGSNSFKQEVQLNTEGNAVKLTESQKELLKQNIATLLACVRVRFDAIQSSRADMVTPEEIEQLEICRRVSQYIDPGSNLKVQELSRTFIEAFVNGHNVVKLNQRAPPQEVVANIMYQIQGQAETILRAIPLFNADLDETRQAFQSILRCIMMSLANQDRIDREMADRYQRRIALFGELV